VKDICLKHVANAKLAALNYVATGASMDDAMTTALAIVTTPMTQDHLDQLKDASTIELWDRMEAKTDSLRLVKQMKHSALEAYYKIRADAVSAIHKAMMYAVNYIMRVAKGGVAEESTTMDDMVSLIGFDLDSETVTDVAAAELLQASPAPTIAEGVWTVRHAKQDTIAQMKVQKNWGLHVITQAKNNALAKIKDDFMDAVTAVRQALRDAPSSK